MVAMRNIVTGRHYKNKNEIITDVLTTLDNYYSCKLSKRAAKKSIDWSIVDWTAFNGQFGEHMRHSKNACDCLGAGANTYNKEVIHEHVVPKKVIRAELFKLNPPTNLTIANIQCIFNNYAIGAVIAKHEDNSLNEKYRSSMPSGGLMDIWERYRAVGIKDCGCVTHPRW